MYTNQRLTSMAAERRADQAGPPSSPPMTSLLVTRMMKQHTEVPRYKATEKLRSPGGTR